MGGLVSELGPGDSASRVSVPASISTSKRKVNDAKREALLLRLQLAEMNLEDYTRKLERASGSSTKLFNTHITLRKPQISSLFQTWRPRVLQHIWEPTNSTCKAPFYYIDTYRQRQNFITRGHFMKQNADFQEGISQA